MLAIFDRKLDLNSANDESSAKLSPFHAPVVLGETTDHTD